MLGNECPECSVRLRANKCPECGWTAQKPDEPKFSRRQCERCMSDSASTTEFHPEDKTADPEDRGKRLCPACWIPALLRRATRDPIGAKERAAWRALIDGGKLPTDDEAA